MGGSHGATVLDDLPEWLVVHEILVRLPVKDVLRCRAVRKSWRSATSTYTDAFILDHHRHQPSLPILKHGEGICRVVRASNDLKIRPVLRHAFGKVIHRATCDGLLILSQRHHSDFYVCNPATRKCASLPHPPPRPHFRASVAGFYRHHTSGEHRVLWVSYPWPWSGPSDVAVELLEYLVLTVGSDQPRCIQWPTDPEQRFIPAIWFHHCPAVHHRGSLHWAMGLNITVFDTIAETFRQMSRPSPTQLGNMVSLVDMDGALALCHTSSECVTTLDVWVLQDYDAETWGFLYQINLLAMEASPPLYLGIKYVPTMVVIKEHELLIEQCPSRLLHCDMDGVFLGNVESEKSMISLTRHCLQESMISLPLFETQKQEVVNKEPLFSIVL